MPMRNGMMVNWQHRVSFRHLLTENEDSESVKKSMTAIYEVPKGDHWFKDFEMLEYFKGCDELDEANGLLDELYDYCDSGLIFVELNPPKPEAESA